MRRSILNSTFQAGIVGAAFLLACASAKAVPYTENLGENDPAGTFAGPGGSSPPLSMGVTADNSPIPGQSVGGHATLTYALSNNGGNQMVPGDVRIFEDAAHTILSDVLRFEDWGVGYVYVYSAKDDGVTKLADTGMPTAFQANVVDFTEQLNGSRAYGLFGYIPTATQPGYSTYLFDGSTSAGLNYAYSFTSDEPAGVPDGGTTIGLLGLGLIGIFAYGRKPAASAA
jgi:hypothetical protein